MGIKISKDIDNVGKIIKTTKELNNAVLSVGIFSEAGGEILTRAYVHEYGAPSKNIPERSFIRAGLEQNRDKIKSQGDKLIEQVILENTSPKGSLEILGEVTTGMIKKYLTNLSSPPLKRETIEKKGSSNPLIDTGQMRDSITYEVR